jgi:hypothetical protein
MNTIVKLSVASALAMGAVVAHASISQPSSGSSDLILFAEVLNGNNVVASYAGDTGVATPSASGSGVTGQLSNSSDSALSALFAADASGDTMVYAVEGGYYTGAPTQGNLGKVGVANFATTSANGNGFSSSTTGTSLTHWATIGTTVIPTLNANFANTTAGGTGNSVEGASASSAGIWDYNTPSGISGWFGYGPSAAVTLGTAQTLYGVTGGGTAAGAVTITTLGSVQLTAAGLQFTANGGGGTTAVPVPPALWLLGSGLLGLAGVARRKSVKV